MALTNESESVTKRRLKRAADQMFKVANLSLGHCRLSEQDQEDLDVFMEDFEPALARMMDAISGLPAAQARAQGFEDISSVIMAALRVGMLTASAPNVAKAVQADSARRAQKGKAAGRTAQRAEALRAAIAKAAPPDLKRSEDGVATIQPEVRRIMEADGWVDGLSVDYPSPKTILNNLPKPEKRGSNNPGSVRGGTKS